jgi:phage terminase large subunit
MSRKDSVTASITDSVYNSIYRESASPIVVQPKVTNIFVKNLTSTAKTVINRGSAGSSKSYSLYQLANYRLLTGVKKQILVVRKTLPSLKVSVLPLMYEVMEEFGIRDRLREEKMMLNYYYTNAHGTNWLHFGSVDDVEKIKSSSWSMIIMEEATDFTFQEFLILKSRLRTPVKDGIRNQIILSFNPIDERHWIKTELVDKMEDILEIHSTYKDNPFLDEDYVQDLESTRSQDVNFWRIMALGEWGRLENIIYSNWDAEVEIFPSELPIIYGVDFGYNVPSVLLKIGYTDTDIWEEELIYQPHLTNQQFIEKTKKLIPPSLRNRPIYCDSAEPDKIAEMRSAGLNAKAAKKNINEGIDFVKRLAVHIVKSSSNIIKEKTSYDWKTDKKTQKPIDEPIEFNDHGQDAERYAVYTHLRRNEKIRLRWL